MATWWLHRPPRENCTLQTPASVWPGASLAVSCACADDLCHRGGLSDGLFGLFELLKWDGVSPTKQFVGLQNYLTLLLNDPVFWIALRNNAIWLVASLLSNQHRLRTGGALESKVPEQPHLSERVLFPGILSLAIVGLIWNWIYLPDIGLINQILGALGLTGLQHNWLSDPNFALYAVMLAATWNATGLPMLLYLAGLQTINPEVLEAAKVDGAGPTRRFFSITFPLLRETTLIVLAITAINSLKVYDIIYAMTYGGPANQTQVLSTWMYLMTYNSIRSGKEPRSPSFFSC